MSSSHNVSLAKSGDCATTGMNSPYGGRYENGTLVVDTVGLSTKNSYIDNFRTPHTEKLHVVERFTIDPDGKNLTALVTVEDPDTFNAPLTMQQRWRETVCAENNQDYFSQGLYPVPEAERADF
jgi:hypothetical protein